VPGARGDGADALGEGVEIVFCGADRDRGHGIGLRENVRKGTPPVLV
jgi:hypothetical protein